MLGKVFNLNVVEVAQATVQSDVSKVKATYLHTFQQLAAEVQACGRSRYSAFVLCKDALKVVKVGLGAVVVLALIDDISWQRSLAQSKELAFKLVVRTVVKEAQCASAAGGIVNHLGHHCSAFVEEQFVTNTYLACRLYQHVPQAHFFIQLAQQEHLNLGIGLFLCAIKACRKNLGIVENEGVALVKIVEHVTEVKIFALDRFALGILLIHLYFLRLAVQHHKAALVTTCDAEGFFLAIFILKLTIEAVRIQRYLVFWQFELKL